MNANMKIIIGRVKFLIKKVMIPKQEKDKKCTTDLIP